MTKKCQKFVAEPMGDKPVTALPGIADALGPKLKKAGFHKARDVLGQYLVEEDQQQFERWLNNTCGANKKQSGDCYQALSEWYGKWGEREEEKTRGRETNAEKLTPARSEGQGRKGLVSRISRTRYEGEHEEEESEEEDEAERLYQKSWKVQRAPGKTEEERARTQKLEKECRDGTARSEEVPRNEIKKREIENRLSRDAMLKVGEKVEAIKKTEQGMKGMEEKSKTNRHGLVNRTAEMKEKQTGNAEKETREKGNWKIAFWNVRGLLKKDETFWKEIEKWDVIVLMETFLEEKNWEKISSKLPKGYKWKKQEPTRIFRDGRASGGMMIGVREEMVEDDEEEEREKAQGLLTEKIKVGAETWTVVGVYVNGDIEKKLEILRRWINEQGEERKMIIGGDFNARTGNMGGGVWRRRRSKDEKVDTDGNKLTTVLSEVGWEILNGNVKGDEEGEFTHLHGKSKTVIDYVLGNETTRRGIKEMAIGDRMASDHHPLVVTMKWSDIKREE